MERSDSLDKVLRKSVWKQRSSEGWSFFCPLCRATRKVAMHTHPRPIHYFQVLLTSLVFTLATWNWFSFKGLVSFVPLWILFETVFRTRVRAALNCPDCGFDPYLYLVDIKRARDEIENHWRKKFAEKGIPYPEKQKPGSAPDSDAGRLDVSSAKEPKENVKTDPELPA